MTQGSNLSRRFLSLLLAAGITAVGAAAFIAIVLSAPRAMADTMPPLVNITLEETASPAPEGSLASNLSVTDGRVYFSWIEAPEGTTPSLRFSVWNDSAWSAARTIVSDPRLATNPVEIPSLLALSDGTIAAAWLRSTAGPKSEAAEVMISTSRDGGVTWAPALTPHKDGSKTEHGFTSLTADPVEGFWAVWLDGRNNAAGGKSHSDSKAHGKSEGSGTQLRAALWRGGAFGQEIILDSRVCDCCQTASVRTMEGLAVAYRDRSAAEIRDISVVRYERRVWGQPFTLRNDGWKISGCPVSGPSMAARDTLLALAWFTNAQDHPAVYVALSDSSAFALSRIVQVDDGNPVGRADVQWLPDQSVLVTWVEQVGAGAEIRSRRVKLNGEKDASMLMAHTSASPGAGVPRLAGAGNNVWMTWTDTTSSTPGRVRVGRLDLSKWD